jgi:RNA polymerase sigma-70 factor (ECF subfamily)
MDKKDIKKYVGQSKNNNSDAFIFLFREYEKLIYKIAYTYLGNQEDALDAVQETAYQSYKNIKSLRKPEYFKTWLCKITTNVSLDILKSKRSDEFITTPLDDALDMIDMRDTGGTTPMEFLDLLTSLSEDEKNILLLKIYYDYTFEMIADENKQPVSTIKTTYYRIIKKLRLKGVESL